MSGLVSISGYHGTSPIGRLPPRPHWGHWRSRKVTIGFNFRPAMGCLNTLPSAVFREWQENGGAARLEVFFHLIPHLFGKFCEIFNHGSCKVGQVTRSGQVTSLRNNFIIAPQLQCLREGYETFGIWYGHQYQQNFISRFLCAYDLRSGHFSDLPIISQWQQINSLFSASAGVYLNGIASCRAFIDTSSNFFFADTFKGHLRSSEVTHFFLSITWDQKGIETWNWRHCVPLVKPRRMMCNLI